MQHLNPSDNKPLQIAYVIETFPSPTEYFILNEILALEKQGATIFVLSIRKPKPSVPKPTLLGFNGTILYASNISIFSKSLQCIKHLIKVSGNIRYPFRFSSFFKHIRNLSLSARFENQLKNKKITHVHAHFAFIATDVGYLLSKHLKLNFSFTAHAQDIYLNPKQLTQKIEQATFVITCTGYNLKYLNQLTNNRFADKIYHVYHGLKDINEGLIGKEKSILKMAHILTVARLVEKKGIIYLLQAIKLLTNMGVNISCTIIGDGPLRKELIRFVTKTGLNSYVTFMGPKLRSEVLQTMKASDIFVFPGVIASNGDMDGLPNVLLEAMSTGVPVISTNISAIPELIEDTITGILIPEKNEQAIANAILKLINDPALYSSISMNAQKKVTQKFNLNDSTTKIIHLFRNYEKN